MRTVGLALAVTLGAQTLSAFAIQSPAVFAPVATRDLGVDPERVGTFVVVLNLVGLASSLASPSFIQRYGPLRTVQVAMLAMAFGLVVGGLGTIPAALVAAAVFGLGNGVMGPVSSTILIARTPRGAVSFVFSLKQTGVPAGGMIAGAVVPALVLLTGWQYALWVCAVFFVFAALAMQPLRADYDADRDRATPLTISRALAQMRGSIALTLSEPRLRRLAAVAFAFVAHQLALTTFAVTFLNVDLGYTLVVGGFVYAAMQVAGIVGRIVWGAIADRMARPQLLLGGLGIASFLCAVALAFLTPAWPLWAVVVLCVVFGGTGVAWNGLFFAEVARTVTPDKVTRATGGAMFFSFLGGLTGPLLITLFLPSGSGWYGIGFALVGLMPLATGIRLMLAAPRVGARPV